MSRTAFEEALATGNLPSYYTAADNLNIANRNPTFLSSALKTVQDVQKFIGVSMISGANEIYNIPANVGNMLGAEFKTSKTEDVVAALDSDLAAFYKEHKGGADLVGFLLSSVVPGTLGVTALNAGQNVLKGSIASGRYGKNMSQALGVLVPSKQKFLSKAVEEIATGTAPARLSNKNAMLSVASGFGQNVLEATAFEVAIATTLSSSPVLENQDFGDFVANIAIGGGVFGVFGGAIDLAKANSAIKGAARDWSKDSSAFAFDEAVAKTSSISEELSLDLEQLKNMPSVLPQANPALTPQANEAFTRNLQSVRDNTIRKINNRVRKNVGELAKGDQDVANVWYGLLKGTDIENQQYNYIDLTNISRLGHTPKELVDLERNIKLLKESKLPSDHPFLTSQEHIAYVSQWGDDVGMAYETPQAGRTIADGLTPGESISANVHGVKAGSENWKFSINNNTAKKASAELASVGNILNMTPRDIEARYIWSRNSSLPSFADTLADPKAKIVIDGNDIPLLEKLLREVPDAAKDNRVTISLPDGTLTDPKTIGLEQFLYQQKIQLANEFHAKNIELLDKFKDTQQLSQREIAKAVNIRDRVLSGIAEQGQLNDFTPKDMLALDSYTEDFAKAIGAQVDGNKILVGPSKDGGKEIWELPQTVRAIYDGSKRDRFAPAEEVNNFVTTNMVDIMEHQRVYKLGLDNAAGGVLGREVMEQLPDITTPQVRTGATSVGAGPSRWTAASANYGSLANMVEYVGSVTSRTIAKFQEEATNVLTPALYRLGQNQEAAIEWANLNATVRSIPGEYVLDETGEALIPAVISRYNKQKAASVANKTEAPEMYVLPDNDMPLSIPIKTAEAREMVATHINVNGKRTEGLTGIRAAQGVALSRSSDAFYPIPVNPKDYKFFGMVRDKTATGGNANRTLFASTEDELKTMKAKIEQHNPQLEVLTKGQAEDYYKQFGAWDYEKTLNSVYLNTEAKRAGVSSPFIIPTDPQKIIDDALSWHMQRETGLVREAVSAKYEVQFEELRRLGKEATDLGTSKFTSTSMLEYAEEAVKNPFANYVKTALAVKDTASYPIWSSINRYADDMFSRAMQTVEQTFYTAKGDADIGEVNRILEEVGYKGAAYDVEMEVFANAKPAQGSLSAFVQKANSTLATVVLRWDFLNAINNAVSANVLFGAEVKAVQRAIARGDSEAAGALANLTRIGVPGTEETIMAPTKLIANAFKKFHEEGVNGPTMQWYRDRGYVTSITDQYKDALDTLSFSGRESVAKKNSAIDGLRKKMRAAGDAGEKWTGNRLAEEFNRFIAADVMKQMTDVAVDRGLMSTKEQLAYINTFVNRTQGNYLASQRPNAFQGPIGQAIGLFQTYQFNLMQQLFRHVGEGQTKDYMTLIGLQGTIHGMNGLPAFNAVNTHIIGSASGNTQHKDVYSSTYGIAGKEAGDFLMYGAASTALGLLHPDLKLNLYTRGDLNPRHITIIPTDPASVPFIQAFGKFAGNLIGTGKQLVAGGDVGATILQGLEHNGISRPLAGLGQTLEAFNNPNKASYSTSKRGNIVAANDVLSLANLVRIAGGKPMDEAVALDATYRFRTYALKDSRKRDTLGQAIKSTMIAGDTPSREQIENFAEAYAAGGGRQEEFAGWMTQLYKDANTSQANEISRSLKSPFTQAMQEIMGGEVLTDFAPE